MPQLKFSYTSVIVCLLGVRGHIAINVRAVSARTDLDG
jgi:hypothetical protein